MRYDRTVMANKVCIYCQQRPGTTKDHVFPFAWYPTTTPAKVQRRTVPCCPECNQRLHKAEDAIGLDLLFCCNPLLPQIAGVHESITRAWSADHADAKGDRKHRVGRLLKIQRTMEWAPPYPGAPIAVVEKNGIYRAASPARKLDDAALQTLTEKFVRGLHYIEMRLALTEPGPHPPHVDPLLPLDLIFQVVPLPNRYIRMPDPRLTVETSHPRRARPFRARRASRCSARGSSISDSVRLTVVPCGSFNCGGRSTSLRSRSRGQSRR